MDTFQNHATSLESPARCATEITPDDSAALAYVTRALYVGSAGNVTAEMADGTVVTFVAAQGGTILPIRVARILATGTTAAGLVGLW